MLFYLQASQTFLFEKFEITLLTVSYVLVVFYSIRMSSKVYTEDSFVRKQILNNTWMKLSLLYELGVLAILWLPRLSLFYDTQYCSKKPK